MRTLPTVIHPESLYSREGFMAASGITQARLNRAKNRYGLVPPWIPMGKYKFIQGQDGIDFIKALAAATPEAPLPPRKKKYEGRFEAA
jgi:hypothetical protein